MSDRWVPTRRRGICEVELDGELVLLDTSTGELHVLNPAAAAVWYELDGEADVEQIAARLSEAAGAEREHVLRDVIGFVDQLARSGLLSASDAALDVGTTALDVGTTTAD